MSDIGSVESDSNLGPYLSWHKHRTLLTKEERIQLETDFQHAFGDPASARVLKKILSDLCFFRRCETEEEVVLNNYAKKLLSYLGDWDVGSEDSIIYKLLNI
jgi:hypothetical protein